VTLTNLLVAVNVIAYVWLVSTGGLSSNRELFDHGALLGIACTQGGQWWRIVTGAFLHGGIMHIAFNMFALWQVGNVIEQIYGKARFALLYAVALAGSGLAVVYFAPNDLTVGASGAIFGLFGALVAVGMRVGGERGRSLITQVLPIVVINLVLTFTIPNISAAGHIGGLITGFLAGLVLFMMPSRRRDYAYAYAAGPEDAQTIEGVAEPVRHEPAVETIEHPPHGAPHEDEGAARLELRDPRE
jgi:membrane associated rhomboid family serine protease